MACTTTAITGRNGDAVCESTLLARMTEWNITCTSGETAWRDSDSAGYTQRLSTFLDATGSIAGKYDSGSEFWDTFWIGDKPELILWQSDTAGDYFAFPCVLITSVAYVVNMDTQEVIGWTANFGADGIFYFPGQAGAPSETKP